MTEQALDKAALILRLLGEEMGEEILERLDPSQAERLRAQRNSAPRHSRQLREAVLDDFDRFLRFVQEHAGPKLKLHVGDDEDGGREGRYGTDRPVMIDPDGDPVAALEQVSEFQLAGALESEPDRAVALLLGAVPAGRCADVLAHLQVEQRDRVIAEMGREQMANPAVIERLVRTVLERALTIPPKRVEQTDRIQRLADVLRAVPKPQRKEMMQTLEDHDPDTAEAVNEKLYIFDDLELANDRTVQKLLTEVDGATLATALSGASETIQSKIFSNLSKRARTSLQEELEFQNNVSQIEITQAQYEVVRALARADLEAE